jgi:hypothetical protein
MDAVWVRVLPKESEPSTSIPHLPL